MKNMETHHIQNSQSLTKSIKIGLLERKRSSKEYVFLVLLAIGIGALICAFCIIIQPSIDLQLFLSIGVPGLIFTISAIIVRRKDITYQQGEWIFDGFFWNSEQDTWSSGLLRIKIDPKTITRRTRIKRIEQISLQPDLPLNTIQTKLLELQIKIDCYHKHYFGVSDGSDYLKRFFLSFYILIDSKLHRFEETATDTFGLKQLRLIGETFGLVKGQIDLPVKVKLIVSTPPQSSLSDGTSPNLVAGALALAGPLAASAAQTAVNNTRTRRLNSIVYGQPNDSKSDSLRVIADNFGWELSLP